MNAAVEIRESTAVVEQHPSSDVDAILHMIERVAADPNADPERVEKFMAMYEKAMERKALLAFNAAMQSAKKAMPAVVRDAENDQTHSRYARLETISDAIDPVIFEHGFTIIFGTDVSPMAGHYRVTAELSHNEGHSKSFHADIPADGVGMKGNQNKTPTHAFGSTMSYGRRYLKLLIFDVTLRNEDDDGNRAGAVTVTDEQAATIRELIEVAVAEQAENGVTKDGFTKRFLSYMKAETISDIRAAHYKRAIDAINSTRVSK